MCRLKRNLPFLSKYCLPCVVYHCIPLSVGGTLIVLHPFIGKITAFLKRSIHFCRWNLNDIVCPFKAEFQTFKIAYYDVTITDPSVRKSLH